MRLLGLCDFLGILSGCFGVARVFWVVAKGLLVCSEWLLRGSKGVLSGI